jgi:hypothetical protein
MSRPGSPAGRRIHHPFFTAGFAVLFLCLLMPAASATVPEYDTALHQLFLDDFNGTDINPYGWWYENYANALVQAGNVTLPLGTSADWGDSGYLINRNFSVTDNLTFIIEWQKLTATSSTGMMCVINSTQDWAKIIPGTDMALADLDFCIYPVRASSWTIYEDGATPANSPVGAPVAGQDYWLRMNISRNVSGQKTLTYSVRMDGGPQGNWTQIYRSLKGVPDMVGLYIITLSYDGNHRIDQVMVFDQNKSGAGAAAAEPVIVPLLLNASLKILPFAQVAETTDFYVAANYSLEDVVIPSSCNFTARNISYRAARANASNMTLSSGTDRVSLSVAESNKSTLLDVLRFQACRNSAVPRDVQVYAGSSLYRTISGSIIPACSSGRVHEEINRTHAFSDNSSFSVSVGCADCTAAFGMVLVSDAQHEVMKWSRNFLLHSEDMPYNASLGLAVYQGHQYGYSGSGATLGNISITCNATVQGTTFTVGDVGPSISFVSLGGVPFVQDMQVEAVNSSEFVLEVGGDAFATLEVNLSLPNGSLAQRTTNSEVVEFLNANMPVNGRYNITAFAVDDEGNRSLKSGTFLLNDTVAPSVSILSPLPGDAVVQGANVSVSVLMSDLNLFGWNLSIYYPNGTVYRNYTSIGVNVSSYQLNVSFIASALGDWFISIEVADDHHVTGRQLVPDWSVQADKDKVQVENGLSIAAPGALNASIEKGAYGYGFSFQYDKPAAVRNYFVTAPEGRKLYFRPGSGFPAHFAVWEDKRRIDFAGFSGLWSVKELNVSSWEVFLYGVPAQVKLESIGGLNVVYANVSLYVHAEIDEYDLLSNATPFELSKQLDVETVPGVLILFFYLALCAFFFFAGLMARIPIIVCFSGILLGFLGLMICFSVSIVMGVLTMCAALLVFVIGILTAALS